MVVVFIVFKPQIYRFAAPLIQTIKGQHTVNDRLVEFGDQARDILQAEYKKAGVMYPGQQIILLAVKDTETLQLFAAETTGHYRFISQYPILAMSGRLGPKLLEGDLQVPEGIYTIRSLNPNSQFLVSLELDYPNEFDKSMAKLDGRKRLGGDIFIHGSNKSVGCLAMGDDVATLLFTLAADVGLDNVEVVISPHVYEDLGTPIAGMPEWTGNLYSELKSRLAELRQQR